MSMTATGRHRFILSFGAAMVSILVLGFGPSFFFRALSGRPELPVYLLMHGLAGTAWFILFLTQVILAARRKLQWHRQLGVLSIGVAVAFVATGVLSTLNFTHKLQEQGDFVAANGSGQAFVYWALGASYGGIVTFAATIAAALYFRRRSDIHGRLMLLATAGLLGPAVSRIVGWFVPLPSPVMSVTFLLLLVMIVYDIRTRGRPHVATVVGGLLGNGVIVLVIVAFMNLGVGRWAMQHT